MNFWKKSHRRVETYYFIGLLTATAVFFGGLIVSKINLKIKPKKIKLLFSYTTFVAAVIMVLNAYLT